jgi:hypothetical protein
MYETLQEEMRFFKRHRRGKEVAILPLTTDELRRKKAHVQVIEEILLREYNAALADFDEAKEHFPVEPDEVRATCERYLEAIQRLRQFLADGTVPLDVAKKLSEPDAAAA